MSSYIAQANDYVSNTGVVNHDQASVVSINNNFAPLRDASHTPALDNNINAWANIKNSSQLNIDNEQKLSLIDNIRNQNLWQSNSSATNSSNLLNEENSAGLLNPDGSLRPMHGLNMISYLPQSQQQSIMNSIPIGSAATSNDSAYSGDYYQSAMQQVNYYQSDPLVGIYQSQWLQNAVQNTTFDKLAQVGEVGSGLAAASTTVEVASAAVAAGGDVAIGIAGIALAPEIVLGAAVVGFGIAAYEGYELVKNWNN